MPGFIAQVFFVCTADCPLTILLYSFVMFVSVPRYVGVPVFHAI